VITVPRLIAAGINPTQARIFADPLRAACALHDISTPRRLAAFVAQAAHESLNFTRLEENLFYTTVGAMVAAFGVRAASRVDLLRSPQALANFAYAGRNGNGPEDSGDGWRYRGRGLFQLTGRANYRRYGTIMAQPYEDQPELVAQASDACMTAAAYWVVSGCNNLMDANNFDGTTRAINGKAMHGARVRQSRYKNAMEAFK
jgi:putative chitinase